MTNESSQGAQPLGMEWFKFFTRCMIVEPPLDKPPDSAI